MTQKRFVVYLDLLGFSRFVAEHTVDEVLRVYDRLFRALLYSWFVQAEGLVSKMVARGQWPEVEAMPLWQTFERIGQLLSTQGSMESKEELDVVLRQVLPFDTFVLSDTVIFISQDIQQARDRLAGLEIAVSIAREFIPAAMLHGLPVRGAITFGEVHVDSKRNVFFGRGFLEAIALEHDQEWIGCCLGESVRPVFEEYRTEFKKQAKPWSWQVSVFGALSGHTIHSYPVPLKGGTENRLVVNWAGAWIGKVAIHQDMFKNGLTGVAEHDRKWLNTSAYLCWWQQRLRDSLASGKLIF